MGKKKLFSSLLVCAVAFFSLSTSVLAEDPADNQRPAPYGRELTEAERKAFEEQWQQQEQQKTDNLNEAINKEIEANTPASVTGEKIEGNGTVIDFTTSGSKAFYTIRDEDQNIFYLIIDLDKTENNVYFLSDVSKNELRSTSGTPTDNFIQSESPNEDVSNQEVSQPAPVQNQSSNTGFLFTIIIVALGGAGAYYFFKIKPKQSKKTSSENEEEEDDDVIFGEE